MKYTFKCEHDDLYIEYKFEGVGLEEMLDHFEAFLRASGYGLTGELDFVEPQSSEEEEDPVK